MNKYVESKETQLKKILDYLRDRNIVVPNVDKILEIIDESKPYPVNLNRVLKWVEKW